MLVAEGKEMAVCCKNRHTYLWEDLKTVVETEILD